MKVKAIVLTILLVFVSIFVAVGNSGPVATSLEGYLFQAPQGFTVVDVVYRWQNGVPLAVGLCHDVVDNVYGICGLGTWSAELVEFITIPQEPDMLFSFPDDMWAVGVDLINEEPVFSCVTMGERFFISLVCNQYLEVVQ